jgi:hypothetical protein
LSSCSFFISNTSESLAVVWWLSFVSYTSKRSVVPILPYIPGAIWLLKPSLAFEASRDPVDTPEQGLAVHQTTKQKESADTTFRAL